MAVSSPHKHPSYVAYIFQSLFGGSPLSEEEREGRHFIPLHQRVYAAEDRTVDLSMGRVCYIEKGHGTPVILLHGLGANVGRWTDTVNALAADYRVLAYDLPGFGKSEKGEHPYSIAFFLQVLEELIATLKLEDPILVGHSLGGAVVLEYLLKHPQKVPRAVVVTPAGVRHSHSIIGRMLGSLLIKAPFSQRVVPRAIGRCAVQRTEPILDMVFQSTHADEDPQWPQVMRAIRRATGHLMAYSVKHRLKEITSPLLVVWGEDDTLQLPHLAMVMHRHIPLARIAILPECGHYPMLEKPDEFNRIVKDFLAGESYIEGCEHETP